MDASGYWDQSSINNTHNYNQHRNNNHNINTSLQHELQQQSQISREEIQQSIISTSTTNDHHHRFIQSIDEEDSYDPGNTPIRPTYDDDEDNDHDDDDDPDNEIHNRLINEDVASTTTGGAGGGGGGGNIDDKSQPSLEQIQRVYYTKGLQEIENLQLFDLSPLANWKLSLYKLGFGLSQLRDDSPDTYWQSDGSNGNNNNNNNNNNTNNSNNGGSAIVNNQLNNPHSITIQFSKKVLVERISIFTNYSLDESYTPSKIRIMAGTSESSDLIEVCTVNFSQPIGWSHIIFNGIRNDGVLKCFLIKLIILANHQEGKDSHIRAIRCFGKKSSMLNKLHLMPEDVVLAGGGNHDDDDDDVVMYHGEILKDISMASGSTSISGLLINNRNVSGITQEEEGVNEDTRTSKILNNVNHVIGFNTGFQSLELKSISSIR